MEMRGVGRLHALATLDGLDRLTPLCSARTE